jgi:hypothetical protein
MIAHGTKGEARSSLGRTFVTGRDVLKKGKN